MHGFKATDIAWDAPVSSSSERLVLLALAKWADDSLVCYPSVPAIVGATRLNAKTVYAAIKSLRAAGLIEVEKGGRNNSNRYRLIHRLAENGSTENGSTEFGITENGTTVFGSTGRPKNGSSGTSENGSGTDKRTNNQTNKGEAASRAARPRSSAFLPPEVASGEIPRDLFNDWMSIRKAKRAPLTETGWNAVRREADKAGLPLARAVSLMVEHSWQGFKADWQEVRAETARAQGKPEPRQGTLFGAQAPPEQVPQYRSPYAEPSPEVKARQEEQKARATRWANHQAALRRKKAGLDLPKSMEGWLEPGYVEGNQP